VSSADLRTVATYRRSVQASEERVWENVHDWEHLPWLHRTSFSAIQLLDEGDWGWRARIGLAPAAEDRWIELELVRDSEAPRYVSRTLDGQGAGTEIWTTVTPAEEQQTEIEVVFQVPGIDPAKADRLGQTFVRLYTQLWDEDEGMMLRRTQRLALRGATRVEAPQDLGRLDDVRARLPLLIEWAGQPYRIVESKGELVAHSSVCPHLLGPLEDAAVEDGCIQCPWHGYRFELATGRSVDGQRLRLRTAPRVLVDGGRVQLAQESSAG
jgi:nitrite reductase/ring-hydroxylating ferredoxin subunit